MSLLAYVFNSKKLATAFRIHDLALMLFDHLGSVFLIVTGRISL